MRLAYHRKQTLIRIRMIDKTCSLDAAFSTLQSGATVMIGGFGTAGIPIELIAALIAQAERADVRGLTVINNNAGNGDTGLAALLATGRVGTMVCSFPRQTDSHVFDALYRSGKIALELVPQGNLAERIRAAGAGIGAFFTPTGYGTPLARNADGSAKEVREIDGKPHILEFALHADFALVQAERGDRLGNLLYRKAARNFGPVMATAARCTVASVFDLVQVGALDPEHIVTPGIFVRHIVHVPRRTTAAGGLKPDA